MAKRKGRKTKGGDVIRVDFSGVDSGGARIPAGDYHFRVKKVELRKGEESGKPYLNWELEVAAGKYKGRTVYHTTTLQPHALFNLRATLEACGLEVPDSAMDLHLKSLVGLELAGTVEIQTVKGRKRSKVVDVFPVSELYEDEELEEDEDEEEDEGEDEEEDEEEEEEEEDEEEDEEEEDEDEEEEDEEEDEDEEDEEEDEDEDEEEEEKPRRKRGRQ